MIGANVHGGAHEIDLHLRESERGAPSGET